MIRPILLLDTSVEQRVEVAGSEAAPVVYRTGGRTVGADGARGNRKKEERMTAGKLDEIVRAVAGGD
jgi:hypothetical protein